VGETSRAAADLALDLEGTGAELVVDPGFMEIAGPRLHVAAVQRSVVRGSRSIGPALRGELVPRARCLVLRTTVGVVLRAPAPTEQINVDQLCCAPDCETR
jgi:hypothetical protein